jgi:hypothetical protein
MEAASSLVFETRLEADYPDWVSFHQMNPREVTLLQPVS